LHEKIILALTLIISVTPAAHAALTSDELQAAVTKAHVFDAQRKFTSALNGTELTISTFRTPESTEQDCKIDATLAAKAAFEADSSLSRITVLFYDERIPQNFFEVPVSLGEVAAFKSGQITQAQLLSGLKLINHSAPELPAATSSKEQSRDASDQKQDLQTLMEAMKSSPDKQASGEKKIAIATPAPSAGNHGNSVYSNYGVSLSYPTTWSVDYPRQGNTLLRFFMPDKSTVEMRVYSRNEVKPQDVVDANPEDMFRVSWTNAWTKSVSSGLPSEWAEVFQRHEAHEAAERDERMRKFKEQYKQRTGREYHTSIYQAVSLPASVSLGVGKTVKCLQRGYCATPLMYREHGGEGTAASQLSEYIQLIVFESGAYTIQLNLLTPYKNAYSATAEFNSLLADMRVAPAKPAAASKKQKH